jgi:peptide/nickel transport system substrate-binding protein
MRRSSPGLAAVLAAGLLAVASAAGSGVQAPQRGGSLSFGPLDEPACLNVLIARCKSEVAGELAIIAETVLEPAFDVGPEFTFRPRLVSRVTFTSKPPFTLTYHIRPEARWSDGVPITARDFVFTHRARIARKAALLEEEKALLARVRSVSALDAKTVRVVLRSRFAGWRTLFGNVLPSHALLGENLEKVWGDRIDNPKTGMPIGSGPFLVERWERGRQLTLVRNTRYWGAHPAYLDRIVIRFRVGGDDPLDWFRKGELDIAWHPFLPNAAFPTLRRERGLKVLIEPGSGYEHFAMRMGPRGHPALRNTLVRRALAYGINRAALVRGVVGVSAPKLRPLESVVFVAQSSYYRPKWRRYGYRPALARRLLERAGCRRGADGIYSCAGERLSLRFVTSAGIPPRERLLSLVQAQLKRSGIEVVPTFAPPATFLGTILQRGDFDVALFGWIFDPNATGKNLIYGCGGRDNYTGYCRRSVTRELDQADRILDERQQARVLNQADAQIARDVPVIPLFQVPFPTVLRASIRNYVLTVLTLNPLTNSENWWLER